MLLADVVRAPETPLSLSFALALMPAALCLLVIAVRARLATRRLRRARTVTNESTPMRPPPPRVYVRNVLRGFELREADPHRIIATYNRPVR